MILVTLAGSMRWCASFSYKSWPVSFSISTAELDTKSTAGSCSGAAHAAGKHRLSVSARDTMRFIESPSKKTSFLCA